LETATERRAISFGVKARRGIVEVDAGGWRKEAVGWRRGREM
jgi:hypothetical protein